MNRSIQNSGLDFLKNLRGFRDLGLVVFIISISLLIGARNPRFLTWGNLHDMLLDTSILSILSIGMMMVLVTGGIDLSAESGIALTGMIVGLTLIRYPAIPAVLTLFMGMALGAGFGAITGAIIARGRVVPIIASLGMMYVYRGLTFMISGGRWVNAHELPDGFKAMSTGRLLGFSNLILISVVAYIIFTYFINHTETGRKIFAVGSNLEAARIIGIKTNRIVWLVYTLSGALYGLAGVMWVSRYASAQSDSASGYVFTIVAACVLGGVAITGGVGTVSGILLGSFTIGIINNALPMIRVSPFWRMALQGAIILVAVLVNIAITRNFERKALLQRKI
ncbi:MAG TPA: ABC transporter permease [Atribacteraceae bacterium]|nr:ABC transporter permease [Atribacteraceae bacterium]